MRSLSVAKFHDFVSVAPAVVVPSALGFLDPGLNVCFPIKMRNRRSVGRLVVAQGVLRTAQLPQIDSPRTEKSEDRLLLLHVDVRELLILGDGALKILLCFEQASNVKPDASWKLIAAGVPVSFEVAPGRFNVLGSQMQLAQLCRDLKVRRHIVATPFDLLEDLQCVR